MSEDFPAWLSRKRSSEQQNPLHESSSLSRATLNAQGASCKLQSDRYISQSAVEEALAEIVSQCR